MSLIEWRGIIPPLVTPLNSSLDLDVDALSTLINYMIDGGVHGIFALGTTGEGPSLDRKMKCDVIAETVTVVDKRVPVLVNVSCTSVKEIQFLANFSKESGVDGLVLSPPFYVPIDQRSLIDWYHYVLNSVHLPVFVYNIPDHTKTDIQPETMEKLMEHPAVVGLKESSGKLDRYTQLASDMPEDITMLIGPGRLFAESLRIGGHGGVAGEANLFPRLFSQLYIASTMENWEEVKRLDEVIQEMKRLLFGVISGSQAYLRTLKAALSIRGLCENELMPPYFKVDASTYDQIRIQLNDLEKRYPILRV